MYAGQSSSGMMFPLNISVFTLSVSFHKRPVSFNIGPVIPLLIDSAFKYHVTKTGVENEIRIHYKRQPNNANTLKKHTFIGHTVPFKFYLQTCFSPRAIVRFISMRCKEGTTLKVTISKGMYLQSVYKMLR